MFSCKHRGGKVNVYLLSHCLSSSISHHSPFSATVRSPFAAYPSISNFSLSSHAIFYICFSPIFSFSLPHRSPPSLLSSLSLLSPLPPHTRSLFPSLPLLAFLCSGPIGSHYIDGPDDSVEWCTLSPVPLQGLSLQPAHAAALSSDRSLGSFSVGTMIGRHLPLSPVTAWYYRTGHRDNVAPMCALCNEVAPGVYVIDVRR